jgi:peroxiredoxin
MTYSRTILAIWFGVSVLTLGVMAGCKKEPPNGVQKTENREQKADSNEQKTDNNSPSSVISPPLASVKHSEDGPSEPAPPKLPLSEIIKQRKSWVPAYTKWYGKEAPDFTVTDLNGKKHTLSEYRGKNVMLIFWATWCPPCIAEIPHLIELRKQIGEDKLIMLGISCIDPRNTTEAVRKFVTANPVINYPVTSTDEATMPGPYNLISSIPSSFFITPDGKIKLVTEGMVPFPQMKAIIEAEQ